VSLPRLDIIQTFQFAAKSFNSISQFLVLLGARFYAPDRLTDGTVVQAALLICQFPERIPSQPPRSLQGHIPPPIPPLIRKCRPWLALHIFHATNHLIPVQPPSEEIGAALLYTLCCASIALSTLYLPKLDAGNVHQHSKQSQAEMPIAARVVEKGS
jgi:hypothetical protein